MVIQPTSNLKSNAEAELKYSAALPPLLPDTLPVGLSVICVLSGVLLRLYREGGPDPALSDECKGVIRGMTRRTGAGLCDPAARLAGKHGLLELKLTGFFAALGVDWDGMLGRPPPSEDNWVSFE